MPPIEVPKPIDSEVVKTPEQVRDLTRVGIDELKKKLDSSENTPEIKAFLQKLTYIQNNLHTPAEQARGVKELLEMVKGTLAISQNRDVMDFFRHTVESFVISQDVKNEIKMVKMDAIQREELRKSLNINDVTLDALDEGTRQIVRRIHTGFYQFDSGINGWVDALGGRAFLWPENIAGIKTYLEKYHPDHPFLVSIKSWNFRSNDSTGKYAFTFTGKPHNIHLAEADYLQQYLEERTNNPSMTDAQIVDKLRKTHAVTLKAQWAIDAFENKYGTTAKLDTAKDVSKQIPAISKRLEAQYTGLKDILTWDSYPELKKQFESISQSRPEMKDILYDIQSGFLDYNSDNNVWMTYDGTEIEFNSEENQFVRAIIDKSLPDHSLANKSQILGPKTNEERKKVQYTPVIIERRVHFYQQ